MVSVDANFASTTDLAHDRLIGNGGKPRIAVVVRYPCVLATIRSSQFED